MSFTVPKFNLTVNIWRGAAAPPAPPALTSKANLAYSRRVNSGLSVEGDGPFFASMTLLLPASTDIRSGITTGTIGGDVVECPAGTGRFYNVNFVDDVGKGFANEHRVAVLTQTDAFGAWPAPIP